MAKAISDYDVIQAMVSYGGSFCCALGKTWLRANDINQAKLKAAFPDEWETYRELAELKAKADAR